MVARAARLGSVTFMVFVAACVGDSPVGGNDGGLDASDAVAPNDVVINDNNAPDTSQCTTGSADCVGNTPRSCVAGNWQNGTTCPALCKAGACITPPSCQSGNTGAGLNCSATGNASCCESRVVDAGTFNRENDPAYPATISSFRLDRFLVTVGRFRAFLAAGKGTQATSPQPGDGAHPNIASSGWDPAWVPSLETSTANINAGLAGGFQTWWTSSAGPNEKMPVGGATWYEAFAFCAWDGGRLPTDAEWNLAAAGGSDQRVYPWTADADAGAPTSAYATFGCSGVRSSCVTPVGNESPKGDGRWGQSDLTGDMWERVLDMRKSTYAITTCNDCADLNPGGAAGRMIRGCSFADGNPSSVCNYGASETDRNSIDGFRCARDL